ncbi:integrase catalytic domain-containing protein [Trichonephila clavipes]|nr:integrase catalytic domain-containing protein [Trichonephila clavipes]
MDKFLSRKRTFDDNKASTSAQTSIVPKIKSRKYSQEYLNFGFTITEVNGEEKPLCVICSKILAADSMKPNKLKRHFETLHEPSQRFDHVHLDLIGPLPPSNGYTYCLTMIDRFSKWPEAQPLIDITAEAVAEAFFSSCVSRFGTPAILTTDRDRQFESSLFKALSKLLGVQKCRTTGYHPQANGMIKELHHPFKSAIKCHATERWTEVLPIILLGLRASLNPPIEQHGFFHPTREASKTDHSEFFLRPGTHQK